jgi:hypothetical protein
MLKYGRTSSPLRTGLGFWYTHQSFLKLDQFYNPPAFFFGSRAAAQGARICRGCYTPLTVCPTLLIIDDLLIIAASARVYGFGAGEKNWHHGCPPPANI